MGDSASARTERLEQLHARLTAAVADLANSDAWRRMLEVAARLPSYSPSNVLLIAAQRPDATRVAGYGTWRSLGRQVRKGEKGIAILAPCLSRTHEERDASLEASATPDEAVANTRELRGFRVVHVFDVTQTEGDPLPDVEPELLTGAAPDQLWDDLVRMVETDAFAVERGDCGGANGVTRFDSRTVRVRDDVEPAQAVKTLAHELGHIRAGHEERFLGTYGRSVACHGIAEVEAESIAYLVTTAAGLDCGAYSVPYVASWSGGDAALIRETASWVIEVAAVVHHDLFPDAGSSSISHAPPVVQFPQQATAAAWPTRPRREPEGLTHVSVRR